MIMKKGSTFLATVALAAMLCPLTFAQQQDPSAQSGAQPSAQQPTQANPSPEATSPSAQPSEASAGAFTGTVVKAGGKYWLKANGMKYQLDDQQKAKKFEGQEVKVNGDLDKATSTIHVTDISPAS